MIYNLAYLHIMNPLEGDIRHGGVDIKLDTFRKVYKGTLIGNGGYTKKQEMETIKNNIADAISFGGNIYIKSRFSRKIQR